MKVLKYWIMAVGISCMVWAGCGQDDEPAPLVEVFFEEEVTFTLPPLGASNGELRGAISEVISEEAWGQAAQGAGLNPENLQNARLDSISIEVLEGGNSINALGEIELSVLSEDETSNSSMWSFSLADVSGMPMEVGNTLPPLLGSPHKYQVSFSVEQAYFDLIRVRIRLFYTGTGN
ncbi:MAG: hypothetical protein AAGI38_20830 [Bacteroidota bacterium]